MQMALASSAGGTGAYRSEGLSAVPLVISSHFPAANAESLLKGTGHSP